MRHVRTRHQERGVGTFRERSLSKKKVNCWKPKGVSVHTYGNQQPINRNAKGLEESYAPGKRFGGHREVNLISAPVRV